jgi:hypothetical protein
MMEKSTLASRSNFPTHAWPNQARGAALPNRSCRSKSEAKISFPRPHHRSPHAPRSHKALYVLFIPDHIGFLPEIQPRINTHRPRHTPTA